MILFNATAAANAVAAMKAAGREALGALPGAREAATGGAVTADARYRHWWLIRFCGEHD